MVFDTKDSARPTAAGVGYGIVQTWLSTLRMSSLIRFYEQIEHRNELNPKRAGPLVRVQDQLKRLIPSIFERMFQSERRQNERLEGCVQQQRPYRIRY